jgi:hypothetical protein
VPVMIAARSKARARIAMSFRLAALVALCVGAGGCFHADPFVDHGDAAGVTIKTVPGSRALADNLAQRHCAEYQRVARYIGGDAFNAIYECDLPH